MKHKGTEKLNCWEFMQCGREKGGEKAVALGVCPAFTEMVLHNVHGGRNCGRACWVMPGTLCSTRVHGPFLEKFKTCLRCDFFNYVEAQEGKKLKNAIELLQMVQADKISSADGKRKDFPGGLVAVCKDCAQELRFSIDPNWDIKIVGTIEFQCRNCGQIIRSRDLLSAASDEPITLDLT